jgi:hypothetical protein
MISERTVVAIMQNGMRLKQIKNQTFKICLIAVIQNGLALQYVKNQTPEICLTAVTQNERALKYVKILNFKMYYKVYFKEDFHVVI